MASNRLAVYGSLAPGKSNHFMLANYAGTWTRGRVRGELVNAGWGAAGGFPGLVPRADAPWVSVEIFESDDLPIAWPALDEFEGREYQRVLIDVFPEESEITPLFQAYVYSIAADA